MDESYVEPIDIYAIIPDLNLTAGFVKIVASSGIQSPASLPRPVVFPLHLVSVACYTEIEVPGINGATIQHYAETLRLFTGIIGTSRYPTLDPTDDGSVNQTISYFSDSGQMYLGNSSGNVSNTWLSLSFPVSSQTDIQAARLFIAAYDYGYGTVNAKIALVDEDNHSTPASWSDWSTDHATHTENTIDWDIGDAEEGWPWWFISPDISAAVNEVISRPGWSEGRIGIHIDDDGSATGHKVQFGDYGQYAEDKIEPYLSIQYGGWIGIGTVVTASALLCSTTLQIGKLCSQGEIRVHNYYEVS